MFVDLVLLPDTDGYRLAEALRAEIGFHARLVALTGHPRLLHEDPVFDAHLVKPVTRGEIEEQLRLAR